MVCDLDHFKRVNDTYGHAAGDAVLVDFAAAMQAVLRDGEVACRLGREDFALVLPGGIPAAESYLGRLRTEWARRGPITSFSSGTAVHGHGRSPHGTLEAADAALYRAKAEGRAREETEMTKGEPAHSG